jgi:hypothetical protein
MHVNDSLWEKTKYGYPQQAMHPPLPWLPYPDSSTARLCTSTLIGFPYPGRYFGGSLRHYGHEGMSTCAALLTRRVSRLSPSTSAGPGTMNEGTCLPCAYWHAECSCLRHFDGGLRLWARGRLSHISTYSTRHAHHISVLPRMGTIPYPSFGQDYLYILDLSREHTAFFSCLYQS